MGELLIYQTVSNETAEKWFRAWSTFKHIEEKIREHCEAKNLQSEFKNGLPSIKTVFRALRHGYCVNPTLEWAINDYLKSIKFK